LRLKLPTMFTFRRPVINEEPSFPTRIGSGEPSSEVQQLRGEVERLYFITEALWRILKEKNGLDDNEIVKQIALIDAEDGKIDGRKAKTPPQPCPKCGRILAKQRTKCMFCGELVAVNPFER
jgi:hypothetical protein